MATLKETVKNLASAWVLMVEAPIAEKLASAKDQVSLALAPFPASLHRSRQLLQWARTRGHDDACFELAEQMLLPLCSKGEGWAKAMQSSERLPDLQVLESLKELRLVCCWGSARLSGDVDIQSGALCAEHTAHSIPHAHSIQCCNTMDRFGRPWPIASVRVSNRSDVAMVHRRALHERAMDQPWPLGHLSLALRSDLSGAFLG